MRIERDPIEVSACILYSEKGVLIQKRISEPFVGYWEFPGGKVEAGEDPSTALLRELKEELSLTLTELSYWKSFGYTYPTGRFVLHFFFSPLPCLPPSSSAPFLIVDFFTLPSYPLLPADRLLLYDLISLFSRNREKVSP